MRGEWREGTNCRADWLIGVGSNAASPQSSLPCVTLPPLDPPCPSSCSPCSAWTTNEALKAWVQKQVELCKPDHVHLCTGSEEENKAMLNDLVLAGTMIKLNEKNWPNCYLARSTTSDVARVESRTYICSKSEWGLGERETGGETGEERGRGRYRRRRASC